MKIITVHGIRRKNKWYETIANSDIVAQNNLSVISFDYGYFSGIKFMIPYFRNRIINKFCSFYEQNFLSTKVRPHVIAHSFGTDVVVESMKRYDQIAFDTIIFSGSILKQETDFTLLKEKNQFERLLNDYGTNDKIIGLAKMVSRRYGTSGRYGFKTSNSTKKYIINRPNYKNHSEYFSLLHMQKFWIQEILDKVPIKYNSKILKAEIITKRVYHKNIECEQNLDINSIGFYARVDIDGNYFAKYHIKGINLEPQTIDKFNFTTAADGIHDIEKMEFAIYDSENNLLKYQIEDDYNNYKRIIVTLDKSLEKNQLFDKRIYFSWYNTINLTKGDTDHWNIQNINHVIVQVNFPYELVHPIVFKVLEKDIVGTLKLIEQRERDNTFTYSLDFENNKQFEGLILYFEGVRKKSLSNIFEKTEFFVDKRYLQLDRAKESDLHKVNVVEREIELSNAATEETLRGRIRMFNDGFWVIRDKKNDEILGYIESLIWNYKEFKSFKEISNFPMHYNVRGKILYVIFVAVAKSHRRNGFSKLLFNAIESVAKFYNIEWIALVAKDGLIEYYKRSNFSIVKELPEFLPDRAYKSVLMNKKLL